MNNYLKNGKKVFVTSFLIVTLIFTYSVNAATLLPLGGSEWEYDPKGWESSTCYVNCYAYAVLKACSVHPGVKIQPGASSGQVYTALTTNNIVAAVQRDKRGSKNFYKTTENAKPPAGYRKVALVIAPGVDYHWYEQNSNGYWSHKQGLSPITNLDASGKRIANPRTADRKYVYVYTNSSGSIYKAVIDYSTFSGFYMTK